MGDYARPLTGPERQVLEDRFGIESHHAGRIEDAFTYYRMMVDDASHRPSTATVRGALHRVRRRIEDLKEAIRGLDGVLGDVGAEPFYWPGANGRSLVPAWDPRQLLDQLRATETHVWMRTERMSWGRRDGRPAKAEVRWFVNALAAIYADANDAATVTPEDAANATRERLAFLRHTAALIDLRLPKNLADFLSDWSASRKPSPADG